MVGTGGSLRCVHVASYLIGALQRLPMGSAIQELDEELAVALFPRFIERGGTAQITAALMEEYENVSTHGM